MWIQHAAGTAGCVAEAGTQHTVTKNTMHGVVTNHMHSSGGGGSPDPTPPSPKEAAALPCSARTKEVQALNGRKTGGGSAAKGKEKNTIMVQGVAAGM